MDWKYRQVENGEWDVLEAVGDARFRGQGGGGKGRVDRGLLAGAMGMGGGAPPLSGREGGAEASVVCRLDVQLLASGLRALQQSGAGQCQVVPALPQQLPSPWCSSSPGG